MAQFRRQFRRLAVGEIETWLLGDGKGNIVDPDDDTRFLCRPAINKPATSLLWSGQGLLPNEDNALIRVGTDPEDGFKKIIGVDMVGEIAAGRNPNRINPNVTVSGDTSSFMDKFLRLKAVAQGSNTTDSMLVRVGSWMRMSDERSAEIFNPAYFDLTNYVPSSVADQVLAIVWLTENNTLTATSSAPQKTAEALDITDFQECLELAPPRSTPCGAYVLTYGMTNLTQDDRWSGYDMRHIMLQPPDKVIRSGYVIPSGNYDYNAGYSPLSRIVFDEMTYTNVKNDIDNAVWESRVGTRFAKNTPSDTPTVLHSVVIPEGSFKRLKWAVLGRSDGYSKRVGGDLSVMVYRDTGNTFMDPVNAAIEKRGVYSGALPQVDIQLSGNTVQLVVTGIASETWYWVAYYNPETGN